MGEFKEIKFTRKEPEAMDKLLKQMIQTVGMSREMDEHLVCKAWEEVSGASQFTLKTQFVKGTLYVNLSSSMVKSRIYMQRIRIAEDMNSALMKDPLFSGKESSLVKRIIVK